MKITDFKITYWEGEAERAIGDANGPYGSKRLPGSFLEICTDENITGYALIGNSYVEKIFPILEGKDPRSVAGIWKEMNDLVFKGGNEGERCDAISAIDLALWDLKAKIAAQPLWKLLGSSTNRVKAYASGIDLNLTDDEIFKFYSRMADMGIDAGKLKVGLDLKSDEKRLGIMKDALSKANDRPLLCIDSNEYWSPKQAIRFIGKLEEKFDITWAEEPARRWDYNGLKKVSDNIKAAVATGENINDLAEFMPLIDNGAVDIVEVGMGTTGLTGAMKVANMAYAYELPVAMMNCPGNTMSHLATNLPNHFMMEVVDNGRELFFDTDHHIEDGQIIIGNEPGFGISVDFDKLNKLKVDKHSTPKHESSPFPRREGAGLIIKPLEEDK
ncbi:MAG: racemase [Chloroflexi bacterium]|nr:racemase [Chloroflexota bacterium]